jgi:hypothetical protein
MLKNLSMIVSHVKYDHQMIIEQKYHLILYRSFSKENVGTEQTILILNKIFLLRSVKQSREGKF